MKFDYTNNYNSKINIKEFDKNKYNFKSIIKNMFDLYFETDVILEHIEKMLTSEKLSENEKNYYKYIPIFGQNDRESVFVKIFYKYYDSDETFKNLYYSFIKDYIKPIFFPSEEYLVLQKTPNIRLHLPNCTNIGKRENDPEGIIGIHQDYEFGHAEEEINLILPITKMYDTNSIFFEESINSNLQYNDYKNLVLNDNQFAFLYLNKWKHYNKINKTNQSRISFDIRIIPFSKYKESNKESVTTKTKFNIGNYFIKL